MCSGAEHEFTDFFAHAVVFRAGSCRLAPRMLILSCGRASLLNRFVLSEGSDYFTAHRPRGQTVVRKFTERRLAGACGLYGQFLAGTCGTIPDKHSGHRWRRRAV